MLSIRHRLWKPRFPENVSQNTTLADVAGKNSWFTMNILQIDDQFLTDNVDAWLQSQASQSSLRNILAINVVNDSAERGVKLSSDFLAAVHSEKHYQNVLQVVEKDRKKTPNLRRKRKLKTNCTFIQNGCYKYTHKGDFLVMIIYRISK